MPKLIHHQETEYDFALTFRATTAPKIGETLQSPLSDDNGQYIAFLGVAVVVAVNVGWSPVKETTVYVRQYLPIY